MQAGHHDQKHDRVVEAVGSDLTFCRDFAFTLSAVQREQKAAAPGFEHRRTTGMLLYMRLYGGACQGPRSIKTNYSSHVSKYVWLSDSVASSLIRLKALGL